MEETMGIESENGDFVLPLKYDGTVIYLDTCTPTDNDMCLLSHVIMSSPHPWNPRNIQFPKTSRRVQEELAMHSIASASAVPGGSLVVIHDDEGADNDYCVYDIGNITRHMISSLRVQEAPTIEHVRL